MDYRGDDVEDTLLLLVGQFVVHGQADHFVGDACGYGQIVGVGTG